MNIDTKKTKIVATIGPASEDVSVLKNMIESGMNVARFNFSHGEHEWHKRVMKNVRKVSRQLNIPIAIIADLQGPRVRILVEEDVKIEKGEVIRVFDVQTIAKEKAIDKSERKIITLDCPGILKSLRVSDEILIEDGIIKIKVIDVLDTHVIAEVINGDVIKNHKGVNIPDVEIPLPTLTEKDYRDLEFALGENVDYIAMSFVRDAESLMEARNYMRKLVGQDCPIPKIISKIEAKQAIKNLDEIIRTSDAIMVARGDLGIEVNPHRVSLLSKEIIKKSLKYLRPVIMATQMLASMEKNARPTRAEIADVTNAVVDHVDAVMLSAEASVGDYPIESVGTMAEIAMETERSTYDDIDLFSPIGFVSDEVKIAQSTYLFAKEMEAKTIVLFSESGYTARLLSHFRPDFLTLVATNNEKTYRQMSLVWGVRSFLYEIIDSRGEIIDKLIAESKNSGLLIKNDLAVTILGSTKSGKKLKLTGSRIV
ncbi:MAG: pyruvate kinase [Candidatus Moranbacteria bacterium]|nr:pyruvate kinase [Candidatus Moranbacteria bacterium]